MTQRGKRVLVVDDSPYARRVLRDLLEADPLVSHVDGAGNGKIALDNALRHPPDLVLLDLQMPVMDGFTFLRLFRKHSVAPVLVISSLNDLEAAEKSLELGAVGVIAKPADAYRDLRTISRELALKIRGQFQTSTAPACLVSPPAQQLRCSTPALFPGEFPVVVIGSSSGGPPTLQYLLTGLPPELRAVVLIAQHLPPGFTEPFAQRLDALIAHPVHEARNGQPLVPGSVVICPGGKNMSVRGGALHQRLALEDAAGALHVPNVDRLFTTAAEAFGDRVTAFVLTGMGRDGAEGVRAVKDHGGRAYAESEETAAIYGMPREAVATGCVEAVLPLPEIAVRLIEVAGGGGIPIPETRVRASTAVRPVPAPSLAPEP